MTRFVAETTPAPKRGKARLLALPILACALMSQGAFAATGKNAGVSADARQRYQEEKAACMTGQTKQERTACLKEANAALYESRRGTLLTDDQASYDQNAMNRCSSLPADQRDFCRRGVQSGNQQGSVEDGGILREYHETVAVPASSMPADTSSGASSTPGSTSSGSTSYPNPNTYPGSTPSGNTYPGSTPGPTPSGTSPSSNSLDQMRNYENERNDMRR